MAPYAPVRAREGLPSVCLPGSRYRAAYGQRARVAGVPTLPYAGNLLPPNTAENRNFTPTAYRATLRAPSTREGAEMPKVLTRRPTSPNLTRWRPAPVQVRRTVSVDPRRGVRLRNALIVLCLVGIAAWAGFVLLVIWALGGDITPEF
jgi:hypothetical protein